MVSEEMFENVDTHTSIHTYSVHTYTRTTEAYLYYKLTNEPKGLGEIKTEESVLFTFVFGI